MLLVVAAPLFFLGGFSIKQKLIQLAMTEKLEQGFLQNITANRSEIVWVKKNKEAIVEGKLFDVKQEIYRLSDRFIYNLGLIFGIQELQLIL